MKKKVNINFILVIVLVAAMMLVLAGLVYSARNTYTKRICE